MALRNLYRNEPGLSTLIGTYEVDPYDFKEPVDIHKDIIHTTRPMPAAPVELAPRIMIPVSVPYEIGMPNRGDDH